MTDHKYIRREGTRGNYKYIYEEDLKNTPQKKEAKNPFAGVGKAIGGFGKGVTNAASNVGKGVSNFAKEAKYQLSPAKTGDQKLGNGLSASHEVTVTGKDIKQPTKKITMNSNGTFEKVGNAVSNVGKDISNSANFVGSKVSGGIKSLLKKETPSSEAESKEQSAVKQKAQETRKKLLGEMDELVVNRGKKYYDRAINRGLKAEDLEGSLYDQNRVTVMDKKTASLADAEANASIASNAAYKRSTEEKAAAERLEKKFDQKYGSLLEENEEMVENADPRDIVVVSTMDYPNLKYVQREIRKNGTTGAIEKVHKSKLKDFNNMLKDYDTVLETQSNAEHDAYLAELMGNKAEKHFYEKERSYDDFREMEELKKMDAEDHRNAARK